MEVKWNGVRLVWPALALVGVVSCSKQQAHDAEPAAPKAAAIQIDEAVAAKDPHAGLSPLGVDEVSSLLEEQATIPVDANGSDTRAQIGTVPGAILLSNSRTYQLSELPEDKSKSLVFYCGNEKCTAAPQAAGRAKAAGYSNVHVMPAGIRGWVKAGKPVQKS